KARGKFLLFFKPPNLLGDVFGIWIKHCVALQYQSHIGIAANYACHVLEGIGAHDVVIAHKKAELAGCSTYQVAKIAIVTEVVFVLEIANYLRVALLIFANENNL